MPCISALDAFPEIGRSPLGGSLVFLVKDRDASVMKGDSSGIIAESSNRIMLRMQTEEDTFLFSDRRKDVKKMKKATITRSRGTMTALRLMLFLAVGSAIAVFVSGCATAAGAGYAVGSGIDRNRQQDAAINQAQQDANTTIINIRNSNGSVTPVRLVRQGNIWIGPRGEQYLNLPTEEQLRPVYGM